MVTLDSKELLFMPSEKIQRTLTKQFPIYSSYIIMPRTNKIKQEFQIRKNLTGIIEDIKTFYYLAKKGFESEQLFSVVLEGMKNSFEHGPSDFPFVIYGSFFGNQAICHGFKDFGDYFKNPETKTKWESMEHIPSKKTKHIHNNGTEWILRSMVDYFEVNNLQGVLFCVQNLDRLKISLSNNFCSLHSY